MSQETETVEQVCEKMKEPSIHKGRFPASFFDGEFCAFAERILAAHQREILVERNLANDHITGLQDKIESLKSLVKDLADALECRLCDYTCEIHGECLADMKQEECESFKIRPLVAKAREACHV